MAQPQPKKHIPSVVRHMRNMTHRQKRFVQELRKTGDTGVSALNAGYSHKATGAMLVKNNPDIRAILSTQAYGAVDRIERLSIDAENEGVRLQANRDIMDRAGYKPVEKVQTTNVNIDLRDQSTADLDAIRDKYEAELRAKLTIPRHE